MNTDAEPRSGVSADPSHKSVAPVKKRALEPSRRLLVLRQSQRPLATVVAEGVGGRETGVQILQQR